MLVTGVPDCHVRSISNRYKIAIHYPMPRSLGASMIGQSPSDDSWYSGYLGHVVMRLRSPCAIVESQWRRKEDTFVYIDFLHPRSIVRLWCMPKYYYHRLGFAYLVRDKAKGPSGPPPTRIHWLKSSRSGYFAVIYIWELCWEWLSYYCDIWSIANTIATCQFIGNLYVV